MNPKAEMPALVLFEESLERIARQNQNPDWFIQARRQALKAYGNAVSPGQALEEWRRTDASRFIFDGTPPDETQWPVSTLDVFSLKRDGADQPGLTLSGKIPANAFFEPASRAIAQYPDILRGFLENKAEESASRYELLAQSLSNVGAVLYVPANTAISTPLLVRFNLSTAKATSIFPRILVILEKNSSATFVMDQMSMGANTLINEMIEVIQMENSHLSFFNLQRMQGSVNRISHFKARLERGANLNLMAAEAGSALSKARWTVDLQGQGASASVRGIVRGHGAQHFDETVHIDHRSPATRSDVLFKSVLQRRARSVFSGLIHVRKAAQKIEAYQSNRNLLLSRQARADTIPKLEIEADDVKCGHGAAVSSVDEEQVFYLTSRGLTRAQAVGLIVEGFYQDVLGRWFEDNQGNSGMDEESAALLSDAARQALLNSQSADRSDSEAEPWEPT